MILLLSLTSLPVTFLRKKNIALLLKLPGAAVSIPSNIAEGCSRSSDKDYNRFVEISLGSSFELETQLLISQALNFGEKNLTAEILKDLDEEQKMLISFMNKLKK